MTRLKKSRKSGPIGVRKQETRPADTKSDVRKKKKPKGQKSGNRNSFLVEKKEKLENGTSAKKDSKLGSKKKISLTPQKETVAKPEPVHSNHKPKVNLEKVAKVTIAPEVELEQIESDPKLIALVERVEDGELLTGKDAKFFNKQMARHQELLDELGIEDEEENDDPLAQLGGDEWDDFLEGDED